MEVFKIEKIILKWTGSERFPSMRMKYVLRKVRIWNYFVYIYCIFASACFILASNNILDIAESLSVSITALMILIKYTIFNRRLEEIFSCMDEIENLNEECKLCLE